MVQLQPTMLQLILQVLVQEETLQVLVVVVLVRVEQQVIQLYQDKTYRTMVLMQRLILQETVEHIQLL